MLSSYTRMRNCLKRHNIICFIGNHRIEKKEGNSAMATHEAVAPLTIISLEYCLRFLVPSWFLFCLVNWSTNSIFHTWFCFLSFPCCNYRHFLFSFEFFCNWNCAGFNLTCKQNSEPNLNLT